MPEGMNMIMRTRMESVSIPDSGFIYKWAQFKPNYSGQTPSALTSVISVGRLGFPFGIRRVVTAYDTAATTAGNIRSDQFFETDTTWELVQEAVNDFQGGDDAYLTMPWNVMMPRNEMLEIAALPTAPKLIP